MTDTDGAAQVSKAMPVKVELAVLAEVAVVKATGCTAADDVLLAAAEAAAEAADDADGVCAREPDDDTAEAST